MPELADIFRVHQSVYTARFGASMLPSHARVIRDVLRCRTPALGGQVYGCSDCGTKTYSYHSCNNRHCPKCRHDAATDWIVEQHQKLLPVPHFLATFTLPQELHPVVRSNQKLLYTLLYTASAQAMMKLALDKRFLGAHIGMIGILHTWTRSMHYHPHVHYIIPAGGIANNRWVHAKNKDFLVHVKPLSILFRAKFKDGIQKAGLYDRVPPVVWRKNWVTHVKPAGSGHAIVKYIAPYVFRVALSNNRIVSLQGNSVTYCYQENGSPTWKYTTVTGIEFMRRFLQHVLPRGFVKVRYFGFLAHNQHRQLQMIQNIFAYAGTGTLHKAAPKIVSARKVPMVCNHCGQPLIILKRLSRSERAPP